MRRVLSFLLPLVLIVPLLAMRTAMTSAGDILQRLNIPENIAHDYIWSSFQNMYLSIPNVSSLKTIARGDRAAIVKQVGDYARAFAQTDDFAKRYAEYRETRKPTPPDPPKSMDELKKEQKENMEKAIKSTEESMKSMSPELQESMKSTLDMFKEQLKAIDDPNNPTYSKDMEQAMQEGYETQKQQYEQAVVQWQKDYPSSPAGMVQKWLEKFLAATDGVDYNAKLIDGIGKTKMFANPEYERKPDQWKMCFRAGKETVEAGRAYVRAWLHDLAGGR
ncbi:MAG: hypothetical protein WB699_08895 [Bacteroidota bacterium]